MSTGIKLDNSSFTVGKAKIVANTAVDARNNSSGHIDDLVHLAPGTTLEEALALGFPSDTPKELILEAIKAVAEHKGSKEEKAETLKTLPIWDYIQRASDSSTLLQNIISGAPVLAGLIASLNS